MDQHSEQQRRRFSPNEKFSIVKEHFTTKTSVSELCRKYQIGSSQFYSWQDQFFTNALSGFETKRGPKPSVDAAETKAQHLKLEVERMREVIAEISAENIAFKKKNMYQQR